MQNDSHLIPGLRPSASTSRLKSLETNFSVSSRAAPLKSYNALHDQGLWHYWANPATQLHLERMGFLTKDGELIDIDKHRRKWHVLEHELYLAERLDEQRQKDAEVLVEQQKKLRQIRRYQAIRDAEVRSFVQHIRDKRAAIAAGLSHQKVAKNLMQSKSENVLAKMS